MITNSEIADQLKLYSQLLDVHGKDSFRAKSYGNAAFQVDRLAVPLEGMSAVQVANQKGIGNSIAEKIIEISTSGTFHALTELLQATPEGVLQLMQIKGIGPKKINTIWKEMEIESPGELLYACNENRLMTYKGFGAKTQQATKEAIEFMLRQQGKLLYKNALELSNMWKEKLGEMVGAHHLHVSGGILRGDDVIETLAFIATKPLEEVLQLLEKPDNASLEVNREMDRITINTESLPVLVSYCRPERFGVHSINESSLAAFISGLDARAPQWTETVANNEAEFFSKNALPFIPAYLRNSAEILEVAIQNGLPETISHDQVKGIIHTHSTYSDGTNTIAQMAMAAKEQGFEYLVISDHSKSAFYANGLYEEKILEQHAEIEKLNKELAPFKIYKSIESDILNDGQLDYGNEVLASFDLVIASVHSNLKMPIEKAMARLIKAIENPYTTILGHPTGRLLLSRAGYPIDHKKIIDACIQNHVAIEINAHPRRLDLDWTWIPYAIKNGAMLSIDPDAHWIEGFDDIQYGVTAARKGGLTAANNLSSFGREAFEQYLDNVRSKKNRPV